METVVYNIPEVVLDEEEEEVEEVEVLASCRGWAGGEVRFSSFPAGNVPLVPPRWALELMDPPRGLPEEVAVAAEDVCLSLIVLAGEDQDAA